MTVDNQVLSDLDPTWLARSKDLLSTSPKDFNKWIDLITYTENLNGGIVKNSSARDKYLLIKTYENFLVEFPMLEKFWCDLSYWLFKLGKTDDCLQNYEKLLSIMPNSMIIWMNYLKFIQFYHSGDFNKIESFFEKARLQIGLHYYSDKFYDLYLSLLWKNNELTKYYILLRRILEIPCYMFAKFFIKWFSLIENATLETLPYIVNSTDLKKKPQLSTKNLDDLKINLKKSFIDLYITTQFNSYQLYHYEKTIFQQFYLPGKTEASKWIDYLKYMETLLLNNSQTKEKLNYQIQLAYVEQLYERCIIVTCDQNEIWLKYINFQLSINNMTKAITIAQRGLQILPTDLKLSFKLYNLYLLKGDSQLAHATILKCYKFFPNNVNVFIKLLNVENLIHKDENRLLELINKKLSLNNVDPVFDHLFEEIQDYKIFKTESLKIFITSYQDSKKSLVYWQALLDYIHLNYPLEFDKYLQMAAEKCTSFENLKHKDIEDDDKSWINMF